MQNLELEFRKTEKWNEETKQWDECEMIDLKAGDVFRVFEGDNLITPEKGYTASCNAYKKDSVTFIEYDAK